MGIRTRALGEEGGMFNEQAQSEIIDQGWGDGAPLCVIHPHLWYESVSNAFSLKENPHNISLKGPQNK